MISYPLLCNICVIHTTVFGEIKLFVVLWFLVWHFSDLSLASKLRQSMITDEKHISLFLTGYRQHCLVNLQLLIQSMLINTT